TIDLRPGRAIPAEPFAIHYINILSDVPQQGLEHLRGLTSLTHFYWPGAASVTSLGPLPQIKSLAALTVRRGLLSDAALEPLRSHPRLVHVTFDGQRQLTDRALETLLTLRLQRLSVSDTGMTADAVLAATASWPDLHALGVGNLPVSDKGLERLTRLT